MKCYCLLQYTEQLSHQDIILKVDISANHSNVQDRHVPNVAYHIHITCLFAP